jgi:DNA-binding response OmpR family regulator
VTFSAQIHLAWPVAVAINISRNLHFVFRKHQPIILFPQPAHHSRSATLFLQSATAMPSFGTPDSPGPPAEHPHLTPTESRLLEVLRSQPGRVFSRLELVQLVMPGTVVLERTIDVHMKALRRKLGPSGGRIETVRRVGYRFAAEGTAGPGASPSGG